jgi:ribosomal protein S3
MNLITTVKNHHSTSLFNLGTEKFLFNSIRTQKLLVVLSKLFCKNVKLQLVRLYNPFKDSKILAQLIGLNGKDYKFYKIEDMLFSRAVINKKLNRNSNLIEFTQMATILNGIKIRLAGRLITQNIVPKNTVTFVERGGFAKGHNNLSDCSTFTAKNKLGTYSVKVWLSHKVTN